MKRTKHIEVRINQRGFRRGDPDLIYLVGEEMGRNKFKLTRREVQARIKENNFLIDLLQRENRELERLEGSTLVVCGNKYVTAYH